MKSIRRGIAVLLAALLIIPNVPAKAAGNEPAASTAAEVVQFNTGSSVCTIVNPARKTEVSEPAAVSGNSVSGSNADIDPDFALELPVLYGDDFFAEDGSYTIQIPEADPFFPYEVQFTCDGEVTNQWFMTPDDTVEIGGHIFRVAADFSGTVMTQMNLDVAGKKVIVYPESKDFGTGQDNAADIPQTYSLLPLEYRTLTVDLSDFTPAELTMVSVDSIFTGANTLKDTSQIMWAAYSNDDYTVSGSGELLNLSGASSWEMIVGIADQLAADNIRYQVSIYRASAYEWLVPTVYMQAEDGNRTEVTVNAYDYYSTYSDERVCGYLWFTLPEKQMQDHRKAYISLDINASLFGNTNYDHVRIFEGTYDSAAEAETATEITDKIWQVDMSKDGAGYLAGQYADNYMTMVMYDASNQVIGVLPFYFYWSLGRNYVSASYLYYDQAGYDDYFYSYSSAIGSDGVERKTFKVSSGHALDESYRLPMTYYQNGISRKDAVTAAYVGQYSSIAEAVAAGAVDIKDTLFGSGYVADYSQGVYFSVFVGGDGIEDQEVYRLSVITQEGAATSITDLHSGTAVTFLGLVDGQGNEVNCYVVDTKEDSYAEYNFPTILVGEDVDITNLAPQFTTSTGVNLYATGSSSPEVSGKSYHNFANGPVQYTAAAENGESSKNYWLQIIKPSQGVGQLYVNSLADPASHTSGINSTREVMLDGYHDNLHDILLINMGTEAISALSAEVVSDVVELDEYWTLKGVYDLAGFSGTDRENYYGELANMAKIRLKVKEGVYNGADISGTLTIKSNGTPLMVMTLTGTIGNPCISTTEIPDAIKYVPYGTMIQNNNKYGWNTVSYKLFGGILPEGMVIKPNGELYGVPRETGTFTFSVYMSNSSSQFGGAQKEFTLIVNENTDTNVDGATDKGYDVTQRIPTLQLGNVLSDQLFVSQGVFDQFAYVFLDGQMLEAGKDYTAESGSTRITILSQTLNNDLEEGTHTLGVEFRTPDTGTLKRAAQNFTITKAANSDNNNTGSSNNNSNNNSSSNNNSDNNSSGSTVGKGDSTVKAGRSALPTENATVVEYTVVSGDTLWKIADRFYGNGSLWTKIFADNADTIKDANKIYVGQVILLYMTDQNDVLTLLTTASTPLGNMERTDAINGEIYVVQSGDSLWKIAAKFYGNGRQWRKIYGANQEVLRVPNMIYAGQELVIPSE